MQLYVRSKSVVSRVIAEETLIIPVRRGVGDLASIYSLNEVASVIWETVTAPRSTEEIVHVLQEKFAGEPEQIKCDVTAFLGEMGSAGLINEVGVAA